MRFRKLAATTPLLLAIALVLPALDASRSAAQPAATPAPAAADSLKPPPAAPAKSKAPKIAPVPRKSWMVGFGAGYGTAKPSLSGVRPPSETGTVLNLRFGYVASPKTVVGVEMSQWSAKPDTLAWLFRGGMPSITFYDPRYLPKGTFVRAGVGYGRIKTDFNSYGTVYDSTLGGVRADTTSHVLNDDGFALLGAIGYEWRWRKHWGIAPQVEYMYLTAGQGLSAYVASASLQVNLYW